MATAKFKMPSDKQIWAEVDKELARLPDVFKELKRIPDRQDVFDKKKAWYLDEPKRQALADAVLKRQAAAKAAQESEDAAYLSLRRAQGKPIVTVKQFKAEFPRTKEGSISNVSQQRLHELYDSIRFISDAEVIQKKVTRIDAISRKFLFAYLAQTYGLYRKILKAESPKVSFELISGLLETKYGIKSHHDIPRASLLLKLVFNAIPDKTIHLYSRSFQLADGYDVDEDGFAEFIKQMGGMEKIRKAYATIIAVDAGKFLSTYEKDAEYSASLNALNNHTPLKVVQLTGKEASSFHNDLFGYFCLVFAHIDPLNQLEIYGQLPTNKATADQIIKQVSASQKLKGSLDWLKHKAKASAHSAERLREKLAAQEEKRQEKEAKAAKKAEALAKKNAAAEKRFAKQRAAQSATKPKTATKAKAMIKPKPISKTKAVAKKK